MINMFAIRITSLTLLLTACEAGPSPDENALSASPARETLNTAVTPGGGADALPTTGSPGTAGSQPINKPPQNTSALQDQRNNSIGEAQ